MYKHRKDHEKRIQAWELSYILNIDDYWINMNTWLLSSHTYRGRYHYVDILVLKLILLLFFIFIRDNLQAQSCVIFCVIFIFVIKYIIIRPYRCVSSNIVCVLLLLLMFFDCISAVLNSFKVESAITTAYTETIW